MTNQPSIQDVLFFPQMRPEKIDKVDKPERFISAGIPVEWIEPLQKLGYKTLADLKKVEKIPGCTGSLAAIIKENKLGLANPSQEEVAGWLEKA